MSARPTFQFDPRNAKAFGDMVGEVATYIKKDVPSSVQFLAGTLVRSLIAATPGGRGGRTRKVRHIKPNPNGAGYAVEVLRQGGQKPAYIPFAAEAAAKASPARTITRRGLADFSWLMAYAKARGKGAISVESDASPTMARKHSEGEFNTGFATANMSLTNTLPYIETLDQGGPYNPPHHILGTAFVQAKKRLDWILTQQAKRMAANWRRL